MNNSSCPGLIWLRKNCFIFVMSVLLCLLAQFAWGQTSATPSIPVSMKVYLDQHYPGWALAKTSKQDVLNCFDKKSPFVPSFVWGDFNGDRVRDYAIQLRHQHRIKLLVFLSDNSAHVLSDYESNIGNILEVLAKGDEYFDMGQQEYIKFSVDILRSIFDCEKKVQRENYFIFEGGKFEEIFNSH